MISFVPEHSGLTKERFLMALFLAFLVAFYSGGFSAISPAAGIVTPLDSTGGMSGG